MMFLPSQYKGPCLTHGTDLDLPEGLGEALYTISIQWKGLGMPDHSQSSWAIMIGQGSIDRNGGWDIMGEPLNSSRTEAWKRKHRFTFDESCAIILNHFPTWQAQVVKALTPKNPKPQPESEEGE